MGGQQRAANGAGRRGRRGRQRSTTGRPRRPRHHPWHHRRPPRPIGAASPPSISIAARVAARHRARRRRTAHRRALCRRDTTGSCRCRAGAVLARPWPPHDGHTTATQRPHGGPRAATHALATGAPSVAQTRAAWPPRPSPRPGNVCSRPDVGALNRPYRPYRPYRRVRRRTGRYGRVGYGAEPGRCGAEALSTASPSPRHRAASSCCVVLAAPSSAAPALCRPQPSTALYRPLPRSTALYHGLPLGACATLRPAPPGRPRHGRPPLHGHSTAAPWRWRPWRRFFQGTLLRQPRSPPPAARLPSPPARASLGRAGFDTRRRQQPAARPSDSSAPIRRRCRADTINWL